MHHILLWLDIMLLVLIQLLLLLEQLSIQVLLQLAQPERGGLQHFCVGLNAYRNLPGSGSGKGTEYG